MSPDDVPPSGGPAPADAPPKAAATAAPATAPTVRPTTAAAGTEVPGAPTAPKGEAPPSSTYSVPAVKTIERSEADERLAPEPPFRWPSPRSPIALMFVMILLTGVIYPGAFTLVADVVDPVSPSYIASLLAENITNPVLFWERPSQIDWTPVWNSTLGTGAGNEEPQYPTNPALINQTEAYIAEYGLQNDTVPLDLVSPSASGIDPDIYPDCALIQVPRVAYETGLPFSLVWGLVNDTITQPLAGFVGPQYVNVVSLDAKLLALPQLAGTTPTGAGLGK
jgi:potassium-transporting ATPase KdpC subunit